MWGHDILETSCGGTPLYIRGVCGAWSEYMMRAMGKHCRGSKRNHTRTSLQRVLVQGRHPLLNVKLDTSQKSYTFDESLHGPSRRRVAVRRLARRRLARLEPCAETEADDFHEYV